MSGPRTPASPEKKGGGLKLATLLGSAALLVLVAALLVGITATRGGDEAAPTAAPTVSTLSVPLSPGTGGGAGSAGTTAPRAQWELYQGIALPYSEENGPRTVDGLGPATGYSHDGAGALFAAAQLNARAVIAPNGDWEKVLTTQVLPGPELDTALARAATRDVGVGPRRVSNQFAGYRIASYTDTTAAVELITRTKAGVLQTSTTTVEWVDGDWKLRITPDLQAGTSPVTITSLAGYVQWTGV